MRNPKKFYNNLPRFFYMLVKENQNSYTDIKTQTNSKFKYGFMAISACPNEFIVDGTFIKKIGRRVLLVAVTKDENSEEVMIYQQNIVCLLNT